MYQPEFKHEFKDYPFDGKYHLCTTEKPAPKGASGLWEHRDTIKTGVCSEGCCNAYECPACGRVWLDPKYGVWSC